MPWRGVVSDRRTGSLIPASPVPTSGLIKFATPGAGAVPGLVTGSANGSVAGLPEAGAKGCSTLVFSGLSLCSSGWEGGGLEVLSGAGLEGDVGSRGAGGWPLRRAARDAAC